MIQTISISEDGQSLIISDNSDKIIKIENYNDWDNYVENNKDITLMCSSSLDWPSDYNVNETIHNICNHIRGNNIPFKE